MKLMTIIHRIYSQNNITSQANAIRPNPSLPPFLIGMFLEGLFQYILCNILIVVRQQIKNRMSLQPRTKNIRVLSAKITQPSAERSRPKSGIPNQTYTRRQMIETVYNSQGSDLYRIQSARQPATNIISQNFQNDRSIKKVSKQSRQKQEMASQILGLKQTINRLVEQLSHQKGKNQNMRKKSLKYEKILTMQFQDQKQWGSNVVNNHLVTGIRSMYDSLKEKYEAKCQEFDNFVKKEQITKDLQNQHYIAVLEGEIKSLKKKIDKSNELNLASAFTSQTQRQANQYVLADLQTEKTLLVQKNKELEKKVKMMNKNIEELQLKIQLDKKLIIEKDNNLHAFERKNKELTKEIQKVKQLSLLLDNQLKETRQRYQKEVLSYKEAIRQSEQKCKKEVEIISKGKQIRIQSLEHDNAYLHKMIQQLRSTNLELNKTNQELREQNFKYTTNKGPEDRDFKKENYASAKTSKEEFKTVVGSSAVPYQNGKRVPQKADKKYHEDAVKTRKIQLVQVLQIAELVRLKLIGQQYSIQKLKALFDYKQQSKSQETAWQRQYITMAEVKRIFSQSPFNLDQDDTTTLSRYLIEDVQEDYVYCDQLNENHRQVVKSIIKTLIQDFPVYNSDSPQYYEVTDTIEKYGKNLRSALNTVVKGETVSKAKLAEVMKGIGIQVRTSIFQLILSKMAMKSNKLNALDFASII